MKIFSHKLFFVFFLSPAFVLADSAFNALLHPIETAKSTTIKMATGAAVGFIAKKIGEEAFIDFKIYMENHPEDAERYLQEKTQFADEFFSYIDKHQSGIDSRDFEDIDKIVREEVHTIDKNIEIQKKKNNFQCSTHELNMLFIEPLVFDKKINLALPNISQKTSILSFGDVDSYYVMTRKKGVDLQRDHIPSYAAITTFFSKKITLTPQMLKDLKQNTSTIAINTRTHKETATFGGKNTPIRQNIDAQNLKLASVRDIVFSSALNYKIYGKAELTTYIKSALVLYERNAILCLYQ